ncbi:MAG: hypothetical protein UR96_C0045G0003 [candidate division WS6 bacterium GW2011_GWC1_36_11]|uniref:Uncharacterized protein n=2 Tax=Candidatus Dojkabacteria TaxID=74243 RepID=A0A0G0GEZ0_9BACT|nr:MAG: hypothetical protein UR96_C0045G0003 [candidate division WS6 bacterium GW2011_GWC1_36_11]KKQ16328.1 MAG: hypothetical protein US29_C0027G0002 [candidate division WS6 bacterium GW2011_GWF1_36_8]
MKKSGLITSGISVLVLTVFFIIIAPAFISKANALAATYFYLSRIQANINGSSATVEYVLAVDTSQTIPTGGTVTITFPDNDDANWCRTAGALTVAGVASSIVDLSATNWAIDAVLPTTGTLAASCTQGSGASSVDTITISNVDTLTAGTTYGVKLTNGSAAGVLGTDDTAGEHEISVETRNGTTIDSGTFKVYLVSNDTVVVSATVSSVPSVSCTISTNSVNLGSLYPGGSYSTVTHEISTSTSTTTSGYYWATYGAGDGSTDAGLYKSSATTYLLASTGSATIDLTGVNAEGFGMTVSDPDGAGTATVPTDFGTGSAGTFGALDRTATGAQLVLYQNGSQSSSESATITYGARAGSSAVAGSYSESVTFVCGGYY